MRRIEAEKNKKMEQQTSKTEWINEDGKCEIVVTLTGDMSEEDISNQALYTIKGLGFGVIEEGEQDDLEKH